MAHGTQGQPAVQLAEFDITINMVRSLAGCRERRAFTLRIPAESTAAAVSAGYGIGWAVSAASGQAWQLPAETVSVKARRIEADDETDFLARAW
jgi:hypothetical protein